MTIINALYGPMLIGTFLSMILYGVLIVQTITYYQSFKRDPRWIRYFILYLFVLESLNTGLNMGLIYEPLILRFGSDRAASDLPKTLYPDAAVTVLLSTPVQLFIAWRIKILSRSNLITAVICFFAFCSFTGGIASTVLVTIAGKFSRFHIVYGASIVGLVSSAVADIVITCSLVWTLYRKRTGNTITDDQVTKIITMTVQTGLITSMSALIDVLLFLLVPHISLNFLWDVPLPKLYTNCLLSTLNARLAFRDSMAGGVYMSSSGFQFGLFDQASEASTTRRQSSMGPQGSRTVTSDLFELQPAQRVVIKGAANHDDMEQGMSDRKV